jgi:hypothetical protein
LATCIPHDNRQRVISRGLFGGRPQAPPSKLKLDARPKNIEDNFTNLEERLRAIESSLVTITAILQEDQQECEELTDQEREELTDHILEKLRDRFLESFEELTDQEREEVADHIRAIIQEIQEAQEDQDQEWCEEFTDHHWDHILEKLHDRILEELTDQERGELKDQLPKDQLSWLNNDHRVAIIVGGATSVTIIVGVLMTSSPP